MLLRITDVPVRACLMRIDLIALLASSILMGSIAGAADAAGTAAGALVVATLGGYVELSISRIQRHVLHWII